MNPIQKINRIYRVASTLEALDRQVEKLREVHRSELIHRQKVLDALSDVRGQIESKWVKLERRYACKNNPYHKGKTKGLKEAYDLLEKYLDNNGY